MATADVGKFNLQHSLHNHNIENVTLHYNRKKDEKLVVSLIKLITAIPFRIKTSELLEHDISLNIQSEVNVYRLGILEVKFWYAKK